MKKVRSYFYKLLVVSTIVIFCMEFNYAQSYEHPLNHIAGSGVLKNSSYTLLKKKAFFTGFRNEIYLVGITPYTNSKISHDWYDMRLYSSEFKSEHIVNVGFTSGWWNRSFTPCMGGLKYRYPYADKEIVVQKSFLRDDLVLKQFLEEQHINSHEQRLRFSNQLGYALKFRADTPEWLYVYVRKENEYLEEKFRIRTQQRGDFQDIQISENGKFAIVVFSNETLLFEYKNKTITHIGNLGRGVTNMPFPSFPSGSFSAVSDDGLVSFLIPDQNTYHFDKTVLIDSTNVQQFAEKFVANVSADGKLIAMAFPTINKDSTHILIYDRIAKKVTGKVTRNIKKPIYIVFTPVNSIQVFHELGHTEFGLEGHKKNSSWDNRLTDSYNRMAFDKYRYDVEKGIVYSDNDGVLFENVTSCQLANSFKDIIINTKNEGGFLYNIDTRLQISAIYDSVWIEEYSKFIFTKKDQQNGFIYNNVNNGGTVSYVEKLTDYELISAVKAAGYTFYLEYKKGSRRGLLDKHLNEIVEVKAEKLKLFTYRNSRILAFGDDKDGFKLYNLESDEIFPDKYQTVVYPIKNQLKYLLLSSFDKKMGLFSTEKGINIIPVIYDTIHFVKPPNRLVVAHESNRMDIFNIVSAEKKLSIENSPSDSLIFKRTGEFESIAYFVENQGYFIYGRQLNVENDLTFNLGPFEKIQSFAQYPIRLSKKERARALKVATVIKDDKEMDVFADGNLVPK